MTVLVEVEGEGVVRGFAGGGLGTPLPEVAGRSANATLEDWTARYARAVERRAEGALLAIGSEMFAWLDQGGGLADWLSGAERALEVRARPGLATPLVEALLAAPWEVLAKDGVFLAQDIKLFVVARRCGGNAAPAPPRHSDLALLFMAAAPEGQHELDYEREEALILEATRARDGNRPLAHVEVEESGALEFLAEGLRLDGPFEALHLTCHGDIVTEAGRSPRAILLFEEAGGGADRIGADRLVTGLGNALPPLVFLSACRTAERGTGRGLPAGAGYREASPSPAEASAADDAAGKAETGPELADPFVRQLAMFAANVLGWDGSVYDSEATLFAATFYGEIGRGDPVPRAAAKARRELIRAQAEGDASSGRHWHLARVYLGPGGGGPLCDPKAKRRAARQQPEAEFLDPRQKKVPVASRAEFVGRRREIQRIVAAYRGGGKGVLVHGMGNLGKSSLAARVAGRMRHRTAVVFGSCSARAIFAALKDVVEAIADAQKDYAETQRMRKEIVAYEAEIAEDPRRLEDVARRLLRGLLDEYPVLLVLDDFEQSLQPPRPDGGAVTPKAEFREPLIALFEAFGEAETRSRLLVTARFDFRLPDGAGNDLSQLLKREPLVPMRPPEQRKQARAKARVTDREAAVEKAHGLVAQALAAAEGNPGLQDVLLQPILAGETAAAEAAIAAIAAFRESGKLPPAGSDLGDFFARMALKTYSDALTPTEKTALGAMTLFSPGLPIPRAAEAAAISARGVADPEAALDRLLALGLADDWGAMAGWPGMAEVPHLAANPLARSLGAAPAEAEDSALAAAVLPHLARAWQDQEGDFPFDARAVEATLLALRAEPTDPALLEAAATAAMIHLYDVEANARAAVALARPVLAVLEAAGHPPRPRLVHSIVNAAERTGDVELQETLVDRTLARDDIEGRDRALLWGARADRLMRSGDLAGARRIREQECIPALEALGDRRSVAVARGKIADILQAQGDLAEARRIREQECIPALEALGDRRSVAVARGKIADIFQARGDLAEARRIREQEQLPVYEALGDRRSIVITRGKIADILQDQGDLAEARRIREQECIPAFEALGDRRSIAVTRGKIADILQAQGDLAEARRIREQECIPAYEALGDRREIAITRGRIADILQAQGDLAEARRIREQECIPAFEALGDRRSIAITRGRIADILQAQGDLAEARRIREQECIPAYEALGDRRGIAVARGKIAQILEAERDLDGALAMQLERLPIAREMNDVDSIAHVRFSCAGIRLRRGDHDRGALPAIRAELREAFDIYRHLQRPDGIGASGKLLGHVLAMGGRPGEAVEVLRLAAAAWRKIGQEQSAAACEAVIRQIEEGDDADYSHG